MKCTKNENITSILGVIAIFAILAGFGYFVHKDGEAMKKRIAEHRAFRERIKNAECKVLRENDTPLVGVKCVKIVKDYYRITTLTGVRVDVHSSRVLPNGTNGLLKPYRGE